MRLTAWLPEEEPSDPVRDVFLGARASRPLEIVVNVTRTQVRIAVQGDNPFRAKAAFKAARKVIERAAVNKVPYYMRRTDRLAQQSRWTRSVAWVERHPAMVALVVGVLGGASAIVAAVLAA